MHSIGHNTCGHIKHIFVLYFYYSDHNKMQTMLILIEIQYINIKWEVKFYQHRACSAASVSNSSLCYENVSAAGVFN